MNMIIALCLLLGSTHARRGRWCSHTVDVTQQDTDLVDLLAPFIGGVVDDGSDTMSLPTTTCMLRGVSGDWPHANAENENTQRRLLNFWNRVNVGFNVTNGDVGLLSKKGRDSFDCYNASSVSLKFTNATMTTSTGEVEVYEPAVSDPRRELGGRHRGNSNGHRGRGNSNSDSSSSDEEDQYPTVLMTFEQTNVNDGVSVTFPVEVNCRAMYRRKQGVCSLKGLSCHDGEYSYWSTDDGATEQDEEDEHFRGMKCIAPEDGQYWMSRWPECAAFTSG